MRFVADPVRDELLHDPVLLLERIGRDGFATGDCDDVATLGATLGESVGLPARFIVLGFDDPGAPFGHVYAEILAGTRWVELDTTRQIPIMEVERRTRRYGVWSLDLPRRGDMLGCNDCQFSLDAANRLRPLAGLGAEPIVIGDGDPLPPGEWECIEIADAGFSPWWIVGGVLALLVLGDSRRRA